MPLDGLKSNPEIAGNTIYAAFENSALKAIDLESNKTLWTVEIPGNFLKHNDKESEEWFYLDLTVRGEHLSLQGSIVSVVPG